jgi:acyl-CoA dehydrogenase
VKRGNALPLSPFGAAAPMYDEEHRKIAKATEEKVGLNDPALHDARRVGARLGELELFPHLWPVSVRTLCAVREVLAYASPLADAVFAVQGLCLVPLARTGKDDVVHKMLTGDHIGGFALTEPEAGSDVAAMRTVAEKQGDAWYLEGDKTFISNVGIAHHFVVFANADPAAGKKGITAFYVPADAPGLTLEPIPMSGRHPLGRLLLRGCRVPESAVLGKIGDGLKLALGTLEVFRTSVGAAALGMAHRALDATLDHVTRREQFGQKLADFQLTQAAICDMITEIEAARLLVAATARKKDLADGASIASDVAMAKLHATEAAQKVVDRAVQLHGGLGCVLGSVVEEMYREVRPLRIYEGATEVLKLLVGATVLKAHAKEALQ